MLFTNVRIPVCNLRHFLRSNYWKKLNHAYKELSCVSNSPTCDIFNEQTRYYSNKRQGGCVQEKPCEPAKPLECIVNPCTLDPGIPEPRVVIIGAGMAGLSAAHRLAQCGMQNFTILEASERPGGRIHSCWLGDTVAELGASWIDGACVANPAFTLAARECLLKSKIDQPDPSRGLFCTSDGRAVDFPTSITAYHTFLQIEQQAAALFKLGCDRTHGSLLNFIALRIQQEAQNFPEEKRDDAIRVMYGLTNCLRSRCAQDLSLISADKFGSYIEIPGGKIKIPLGYIGILAPLLRDMPKCPIQYSKPVDCIKWSGIKDSNPRAVVKCKDGTEFMADYVIVTVSLGVLKKTHQHLFSPALPHEKVEAIDKLGYGHVNKIYLQYAKPFWVWKEGCMNLAWSLEELLDRKEWVKGIGQIEEVENSQHVLCVYVAGTEAEIMELQSDEEVVKSITELFRKFTGDPTLPYPSTILRSRWSSDPYFSGAYSYLGVESTIEHQCELATSLPASSTTEAPVILFAGEATIPGHYSTVHGARLSGIREAEKIIQLTKRFKGLPKSTKEIKEEIKAEKKECEKICPS